MICQSLGLLSFTLSLIASVHFSEGYHGDKDGKDLWLHATYKNLEVDIDPKKQNRSWETSVPCKKCVGGFKWEFVMEKPGLGETLLQVVGPGREASSLIYPLWPCWRPVASKGHCVP